MQNIKSLKTFKGTLLIMINKSKKSRIEFKVQNNIGWNKDIWVLTKLLKIKNKTQFHN
jgi:hypothetical protein